VVFFHEITAECIASVSKSSINVDTYLPASPVFVHETGCPVVRLMSV